MKEELIKIKDIIVNDDTYPRESLNKSIIIRYADSMKMGAVFPLIQLARRNGELFMIDGRHRLEAEKLREEKYIKAIVRDDLTKEQILMESVRLNAQHGNPFTWKDRKKIFKQFKIMQLTKEEMSKILMIPVSRIRNYKPIDVRGVFDKNIFSGKRRTYNEKIKRGERNLDEFESHSLALDFLNMLKGDFPKSENFINKLKEIKKLIDGICGEV